MRTVQFALSLCLLLCVTADMAAQQKKPAAVWRFHSINNIGLLEGEAGSAFQLQSINGVQYKTWFAGAGAGLDYYRFRSVPIFLDIRKMFPLAANTFFVYGDIGMHANWLTEKQKNSNSYVAALSDFNNGLYTDAGAGYQICLGNKGALLISAGYSFKSLRGTQIDYTPMTYDGPPAITRLRYDLSRVAIKMGLKF
jgi:hypothetical protein